MARRGNSRSASPKGVTLPGRVIEVRLGYGTVEIVCEVIVESRPVGPTIGVDLGVNTIIAATDGAKAVLVSGREIKATIQLRNKRLGKIVSKQARETQGSRRHKRLQRAKYRMLNRAKNKGPGPVPQGDPQGRGRLPERQGVRWRAVQRRLPKDGSASSADRIVGMQP